MLMSKAAARKVNDYQTGLRTERKQMEYDMAIDQIRSSALKTGVFKMSLSAFGK